MLYDESSANDIMEKYSQLYQHRRKLLLQLMSLAPSLKNQKANEYLMQGVGRRLDILGRCIDNVFVIFPITRRKRLLSTEMTDLGINLHAFFVNVSGILDNLGWVFAYEAGLVKNYNGGKLQKHDVGIFNKKTQIFLPERLVTYLSSKRLVAWYSEYCKNYRDTLAHRIPLYVPPAILNKKEQEQYFAIQKEIDELDLSRLENHAIYEKRTSKQKALGQVAPFFAHSLEEGCRPVMLHAQVVCDYLTVEEIISKSCDEFKTHGRDTITAM